MFGFVTSSIATISSLFDSEIQITVISAVVAFGFLFNAQILTQKFNQFRDRASAGEVAAEKAFARLHLFSVTIFGSQFLASLYLIISQTLFYLEPYMIVFIRFKSIYLKTNLSRIAYKLAILIPILVWTPIGEAQSLTSRLKGGVGLACEKKATQPKSL